MRQDHPRVGRSHARGSQRGSHRSLRNPPCERIEAARPLRIQESPGPRRRKEIEIVSEVEVFKRDYYTCQLCGKGLLLNLRPRHPKGPSVDHIVWLSRGGSHTFDNCQTAHLGCNTREGRPYMDGAQPPGAANRARRDREARERRSSAARLRYERRRQRELLTGCIWIVVILVVVIALSFLSTNLSKAEGRSEVWRQDSCW